MKNLFGLADARAVQRQMDYLTHTWMRKFGDDFAPSAQLMKLCFNLDSNEPLFKPVKTAGFPGGS